MEPLSGSDDGGRTTDDGLPCRVASPLSVLCRPSSVVCLLCGLGALAAAGTGSLLRIVQVDIETERTHLLDQHVERLGDARLERVVAAHDRLVDLGAAGDVVGFGVSTTRSGEKTANSGQVQIQTLPRRAVDLTVYLPRGSEDGEYQLQFLNSRDDVILSTKAQAAITRGLTEFSVPVDLTKISPGTYTVRSRRLPDGIWRMSSVTVQ